MAIPDYQTLMLPLLKLASDGEIHEYSNACDILAKQFGLTREDRLEMLPSGRAPIFRNRVGWAKTYLTKSGLLKSTARGKFVITDRGKSVLNSGVEKIDNNYLKQFPEFLEFQSRGPASTNKNNKKFREDSRELQLEKTPNELLESAYNDIYDALADEILEQVKSCSAGFFEKLVLDLLVAMGYGGAVDDPGKHLGRSGDGGIDGIIKEDRLGLDMIYIQAKKWEKESLISRPEIQKFVGALQGRHANKGVFITTTSFSKPAMEYVKNLSSKVVLIDGEQLAKFMIDFNIGVSIRSSYQIKQLDSDYFYEV